jgi:hypothetical protein
MFGTVGRDRNINEISTKGKNLSAKAITEYTCREKRLYLSNIIEVQWKSELRLEPSAA